MIVYKCDRCNRDNNTFREQYFTVSVSLREVGYLKFPSIGESKEREIGMDMCPKCLNDLKFELKNLKFNIEDLP